MSKFMTYAITNEYVPLGEVEAPSAEVAAHKAEGVADERGVEWVEIIAVAEFEEG